MKKLGKGIVKARYILLGLLFVLVGISCYLMTRVNINYDMTQYLDSSSTSSVALETMQDEFGSVGQCQVMVSNVDFDTALAISTRIQGVNGVASVIFDANDESYYKNVNGESKALYKVFLETGNYDIETYAVLDNIRDTLKEYNTSYNGGAVETEFLTNSLDKDMVIILAIVAVIVLIILTIVGSSWIEPLVFAIVVVSAILMNMGSNIILNYIPYIGNKMSFITKSIAAVMQLALSMDYAIVLLHAYKEQKTQTSDKKEAMASAISKSLAPVSSSSITTVAGLVALMFMSFSIGFDVGLVLAKGIVISLLSVFLFMPSILLIFDPLLEKTKHKTIDEILIKANEKRIARFQKHNRKAPTFADFQKRTKYLIPVIAVLIIAVGALFNFKSEYSFVLEASTDKNATVNVENKEINDVFGNQNTLVVLLPKNTYTYQKELELRNYLMSYEYNGNKIINSEQGLTTYGVNIPMTTAQISAKFGLPETVVGKLYEAMNKQTATVQELIGFLSNNTVDVNQTITDYCESLQNDANNATAQAIALGLLNSDYTINPEKVSYYQNIVDTYAPYYMAGALTEETELKKSTYESLANALTKLNKDELEAGYPFFKGDNAIALTQATGYCYNFYAAAVTSAKNAVVAYGQAIGQKLSESLPTYVGLIAQANASLESDNYYRVIFNMNMPVSGNDSFKAINEMTDYIYSNFDNVKVVNETFVYSQIKDVFNKDITKVNLISFIAILVIIAITFKGYFVPVLLTLLIQGAIWITMGLSTMFGEDIFFICYIVVMCVQMGATIDYGILITNHYIENRKTMNKVNAMGKAMNSSLMTVFTSGSILVLATLIIGLVSRVKIVSDLGLLLSRGCFISVLMILFVLPQFLILFDKVIEKTSFKTKFYNNPNADLEKIIVSDEAKEAVSEEPTLPENEVFGSSDNQKEE